MEAGLNFGLLRISVCQILKVCGFDKISSVNLDIITDLYIRFFTKLLKKSIELSQHNNRGNKVQVPDIAQAMVDIGFIKPVNLLDPFDLSPSNHVCLDPLKEFITSKKNLQIIKINKIDQEFLIKDVSNKTKNNLNLTNISLQQQHQQHQQDNKNEDIDIKDWIHYLISKKTKLGKELTFQNTKFSRYTNSESTNSSKRSNNDFLIIGPPISQNLINCLPYNQQYDCESDEEFNNDKGEVSTNARQNSHVRLDELDDGIGDNNQLIMF